MKKISFFWRTVFTTMFAVILTLGVCLGLFWVSTEVVGNYFEERKMEDTLIEIKNKIENAGLTEELQSKLSVSPYQATIRKDGQYVFPTYTVYNEETGEMFTVIDNTNSDSVLSSVAVLDISSEAQLEFNSAFMGDWFNFMEKNGQAMYENSTYDIDLLNITTMVNKETQRQILFQLLPYFLIGGGLVSFVISFMYAKYFSKKIITLTTIVEEMGDMQLTEIPVAIEGDELQQLQNNLYDMYQKLQTTMDELDEEVAYTKKLEEDKQIFMRGATHELKTPIMAMSVMLEGMIEDFGVYQDRDVYLQKAQKMLVQMERLVNEILSVSKLEHLQFEGRTEMKPIIKEITEHLSMLLEEKELILDATLPENSPIIGMDKKSFQKVYSNLLSNAIHYAADASTITIKLDSEKMTIQNIYQENISLTEEEMISAFTTSDEEEGHGLGLYVVDMLCQRYNIQYEIIIENEEKRFTFELFI